jgi:hypothetical protein
MFNLPDGDSPELLQGQFNFERYFYEVCFETVEEQYGLFGNRTREVKRYYITEQRKCEAVEKSIRFLKVQTYNYSANDYSFLNLSEGYDEHIVYWDNSTDPINLLTFLKGRLDLDSHKDYVIFSSKDLE